MLEGRIALVTGGSRGVGKGVSDALGLEAAAYLDLSNSESPQFIGRAVAALAADPNILALTGSVVVAAACAERYGFVDVDGRRPKALTIENV